MAKKKKPQQFGKTVGLELHENLEEALAVFDMGDSDTPESIYEAAWEAKDHFMKEWIEGFDEDDTPTVAQIEAAEEAVDTAIQQAYSDSFQVKQGEALAQAAQYLADKTDAEMQFSYDRDKNQIIVELDQSFMKAWEEATTGMGRFAWDEDFTLKDVKSVSKVIDILDERGEVYGYQRLRQLYDDEWDRWEPGGDLRYHHLVKIAEEAVKAA